MDDRIPDQKKHIRRFDTFEELHNIGEEVLPKCFGTMEENTGQNCADCYHEFQCMIKSKGE